MDKSNVRFHEKVFDQIFKICSVGDDDEILDAGCGNCTHAMAFARRGARILGIDFSDAALSAGREMVSRCGRADQITLQREDLTALSFPNNRFSCVICWGVMMHVPQFDKAIAELARVTRPNGFIAVHENNRMSVDAIVRRLARKHIRGHQTIVETAAGDEYWKTTPAGTLLARVADIDWMIEKFRDHGCQLERRLPVQFTEIYTKLDRKIARDLVHAWNGFWFDRVGHPKRAFGNLVIFRKAAS